MSEPIHKTFPNIMWNSKQNHWLVPGIIFLLSLALRWFPATFGLPYLHYWDEPAYIKLTLQMIRTGNFDHSWYRLPPFFLYQHVAVQTLRYLSEAKSGNLLDPNDLKADIIERNIDPSVVLWSRRYTAVLGALSCVVLYFLTKDLFGQKIAFLSGLILAIMQGHIEHSLVITADVPLGFMVLITLWLTLRPEAGSTAWTCLCLGISAGLCTAVKYNGACILLVPWVMLGVKKNKNPFLWLAVAGGFLAGFTLGFPYWVMRFPEFITAVATEFYHYNTEFELEGMSHQYGFVFVKYLILTGMGWVLSLLALIGIIHLFRSLRSSSFFIFFCFPIVYGFSLLQQRADFCRNLIPLFPWLAIFSALGIQAAQEWLKSKTSWMRKPAFPLIVWGCVSLLIVYPSFAWILKLMRTADTRIQLADRLSSDTGKEDIIGIPRDLHILPDEQKRIHRSLVVLETSDLPDQTLIGLNLVVCGNDPGYLKVLTLNQSGGRLNDWRRLEAARADRIREFVHQLNPLFRIPSPHIYLPRSTFSTFFEGNWVLEAYSVNPSLVVAAVKANPYYQIVPPTTESFKVEKWEWKVPHLDQTLMEHSLSIGNVPYPFGIGAHAGTRLMFAVPEGALRFLVDVGIAGDIPDRNIPSITAAVKFTENRIYQSGILKKDSSIWRVDAPIEGSREIQMEIGDAGDGFNSDHTVLGYCAFVFAQTADPAH